MTDLEDPDFLVGKIVLTQQRRFISPVGGNDVSAGILQAEMVEHLVQGREFVRVLAGLNDDNEESFEMTSTRALRCI